ncbi:MAG: hypothetical protein NUV65_06840 [Candidatus Roizmanbacteria bacterium]|nr:hypothetical protein [Candidatus Roizmanbacteria bacterium]
MKALTMRGIQITEEVAALLDEQKDSLGEDINKIVSDLIIAKYGKGKKKIIDACEHSSQETADLINIFKTINPTINFGNKTTRKAAGDLIKQFGKEKAFEYATYAVSVFGKPYAPVITTPYELREKLSKLAAFHTSDKNKKEKVTVTKTF